MKKPEQKIVPNLWFDHQAEEATEFYIGIFEDSGVDSTVKYPEAGQEIHGKQPGSVMTVDFHLKGYRMIGINGGPHFTFNPSISFFVMCREEKEIETLWSQLLSGGEALMPLQPYDWSPKFGWLKDKYGVNWQLMLHTGENISQKIIPMLYFTGQRQGDAEAAINFYTSIFDNANVEGIVKYDKEDQNDFALGAVKHAQFQLEGETFMAMDSGMENDFPFNEAISFMIVCQDQKEIDKYWERLTAEGDPGAQQCGWLKDKFGVSWQVVPQGMDEILNSPDKEKANRAMEAMLQMKKIDWNVLKRTTSKSHI